MPLFWEMKSKVWLKKSSMHRIGVIEIPQEGVKHSLEHSCYCRSSGLGLFPENPIDLKFQLLVPNTQNRIVFTYLLQLFYAFLAIVGAQLTLRYLLKESKQIAVIPFLGVVAASVSCEITSLLNSRISKSMGRAWYPSLGVAISCPNLFSMLKRASKTSNAV